MLKALKCLFRKYDKRGTGMIGRSRLIELLTGTAPEDGEFHDAGEFADVLEELDSNWGDPINYCEFLDCVFEGESDGSSAASDGDRALPKEDLHKSANQPPAQPRAAMERTMSPVRFSPEGDVGDEATPARPGARQAPPSPEPRGELPRERAVFSAGDEEMKKQRKKTTTQGAGAPLNATQSTAMPTGTLADSSSYLGATFVSYEATALPPLGHLAQLPEGEGNAESEDLDALLATIPKKQLLPAGVDEPRLEPREEAPGGEAEAVAADGDKFPVWVLPPSAPGTPRRIFQTKEAAEVVALDEGLPLLMIKPFWALPSFTPSLSNGPPPRLVTRSRPCTPPDSLAGPEGNAQPELTSTSADSGTPAPPPRVSPPRSQVLSRPSSKAPPDGPESAPRSQSSEKAFKETPPLAAQPDPPSKPAQAAPGAEKTVLLPEFKLSTVPDFSELPQTSEGMNRFLQTQLWQMHMERRELLRAQREAMTAIAEELVTQQKLLTQHLKKTQEHEKRQKAGGATKTGESKGKKIKALIRKQDELLESVATPLVPMKEIPGMESLPPPMMPKDLPPVHEEVHAGLKELPPQAKQLPQEELPREEKVEEKEAMTVDQQKTPVDLRETKPVWAMPSSNPVKAFKLKKPFVFKIEVLTVDQEKSVVDLRTTKPIWAMPSASPVKALRPKPKLVLKAPQDQFEFETVPPPMLSRRPSWALPSATPVQITRRLKDRKAGRDPDPPMIVTQARCKLPSSPPKIIPRRLLERQGKVDPPKPFGCTDLPMWARPSAFPASFPEGYFTPRDMVRQPQWALASGSMLRPHAVSPREETVSLEDLRPENPHWALPSAMPARPVQRPAQLPFAPVEVVTPRDVVTRPPWSLPSAFAQQRLGVSPRPGRDGEDALRKKVPHVKLPSMLPSAVPLQRHKPTPRNVVNKAPWALPSACQVGGHAASPRGEATGLSAEDMRKQAPHSALPSALLQGPIYYQLTPRDMVTRSFWSVPSAHCVADDMVTPREEAEVEQEDLRQMLSPWALPSKGPAAATQQLRTPRDVAAQPYWSLASMHLPREDQVTPREEVSGEAEDMRRELSPWALPSMVLPAPAKYAESPRDITNQPYWSLASGVQASGPEYYQLTPRDEAMVQDDLRKQVPHFALPSALPPQAPPQMYKLTPRDLFSKPYWTMPSAFPAAGDQITPREESAGLSEEDLRKQVPHFALPSGLIPGAPNQYAATPRDQVLQPYWTLPSMLSVAEDHVTPREEAAESAEDLRKRMPHFVLPSVLAQAPHQHATTPRDVASQPYWTMPSAFLVAEGQVTPREEGASLSREDLRKHMPHLVLPSALSAHAPQHYQLTPRDLVSKPYWTMPSALPVAEGMVTPRDEEASMAREDQRKISPQWALPSGSPQDAPQLYFTPREMVRQAFWTAPSVLPVHAPQDYELGEDETNTEDLRAQISPWALPSSNPVRAPQGYFSPRDLVKEAHWTLPSSHPVQPALVHELTPRDDPLLREDMRKLVPHFVLPSAASQAAPQEYAKTPRDRARQAFWAAASAYQLAVHSVTPREESASASMEDLRSKVPHVVLPSALSAFAPQLYQPTPRDPVCKPYWAMASALPVAEDTVTPREEGASFSQTDLRRSLPQWGLPSGLPQDAPQLYFTPREMVRQAFWTAPSLLPVLAPQEYELGEDETPLEDLRSQISPWAMPSSNPVRAPQGYFSPRDLAKEAHWTMPSIHPVQPALVHELTPRDEAILREDLRKTELATALPSATPARAPQLDIATPRDVAKPASWSLASSLAVAAPQSYAVRLEGDEDAKEDMRKDAPTWALPSVTLSLPAREDPGPKEVSRGPHWLRPSACALAAPQSYVVFTEDEEEAMKEDLLATTPALSLPSAVPMQVFSSEDSEAKDLVQTSWSAPSAPQLHAPQSYDVFTEGDELPQVNLRTRFPSVMLPSSTPLPASQTYDPEEPEPELIQVLPRCKLPSAPSMQIHRRVELRKKGPIPMLGEKPRWALPSSNTTQVLHTGFKKPGQHWKFVPGYDATEEGRTPVPKGEHVLLEEIAEVRGWDAMSYENQMLAGLVADMLKAHGWWQAEKETMRVQNVTGLGNSTVYKVSVPRCDPCEVALYKRYLSPDLAADVISQERMTAAAHLLQSHNLAPHRLAEGGDWFIQAWEGDGSPMFENVDEFRSLGTFVAKLHQLPTDWYDEYRSKLCSAWPILEEIPRGSHAWFAAMQFEKSLSLMDESCFHAWVADYFYGPRTSVGKRIVTTHGDLHRLNLIETKSGYKANDLEFTIVSDAIQDLSFIVDWINGAKYGSSPVQRAQKKRAFLHSYLQGMNEPCGPEAVEELLMDAEIAWLCHPWSPLAPLNAQDPACAPTYFRMLAVCKDIVNLARGEGPASSKMRDDILGDSFEAVYKRLCPSVTFSKFPPLPQAGSNSFDALVELPHTNWATPNVVASQVSVATWLRMDPAVGRRRHVTHWHTYAMRADVDGTVTFTFDGTEIRRFKDMRYSDGKLLILPGASSMSLTNVRVNGESLTMEEESWEMGPKVTFHDGPLGFAIIERNPSWNVCENYMQSRQTFQRPLEVVAEMRAEGKEEVPDGFAMSLFSKHIKANSGYCFMSHGTMLEIGVDNCEDQSEHFVTRMNPTFTICEAMTHYMGHSSFFFGYRDGGLVLHTSPGRGLKGDKAFKDDGHTLHFSYNGINDGRWHHVATVYDAAKKHAALFVDGDLVETHRYSEAIAPRLVEVGVGAPATSGPAAFGSTIQLAERRRADGGLERPWLHAHVAVRNYIFPGGDADRRDDEESFYISVHDREVNQSQWLLIPAGEPDVYYIRLVTHDEWNPWNRSTCWSDTWKAFPYLTAVEEYEYDYRDYISTRVFVAREPRGDSSRWRLVPSEDGDDLFHIQLVGTRGVNLPNGSFLYAYEDEDDDIRDEFSSYPCVHDTKRSVWRLHTSGGQLHHREFHNPSPLQGQQSFPSGAAGGLCNTAMYTKAISSKDVLRLFNTHKGDFIRKDSKP